MTVQNVSVSKKLNKQKLTLHMKSPFNIHYHNKTQHDLQGNNMQSMNNSKSRFLRTGNYLAMSFLPGKHHYLIPIITHFQGLITARCLPGKHHYLLPIITHFQGLITARCFLLQCMLKTD